MGPITDMMISMMNRIIILILINNKYNFKDEKILPLD